MEELEEWRETRHGLQEQQRELEGQSVAAGIVQYKKEVEQAAKAGYYSVSKPGRALLSDWHEPFVEHLNATCKAQKRKRSRPPT